MYLLLLGIVLVLMKYLEVSSVAEWSWWVVLIPFGLAAIWWTWADLSGYSKRRAMDQMDAKKKARLEKQREALGLKTTKRR